MKLFKYLKFGILFLAISFSNCEVLEDLGESDDSTVNFHIHSSSSVDYAKITVNGTTKTISKVGDINSCDGGDYIGLASFTSSASSMNYVVKDLNGNQLASGSVSLGADCIDYTFD